MSVTDPTAPEPLAPDPALDPVAGRFLDELGANATVAPLTRLIDGWLCKVAADLPFRRANAVLPPPEAGGAPEAAAVTLDAIEAWYGGLGRPVLVQVSSADPHAGGLDELLARRGYAMEAPVDVLVAETDGIVEAGGHAADGLRVAVEERSRESSRSPEPSTVAEVELIVDVGIDGAWAQRYGALHGDAEVGRARTEAYGRMLSALGPSVLASTATVGDDAVGISFAVLERGWAGIYGMATAPRWQRTGVAGALLGAVATEARRHHGARLYLQVETDNHAAQSLYRGLGFTTSHGYHYRVLVPSTRS